MSDVPSLLPPNATASERAIEQAIARAADVPLPQRSLWDPDTCPVALLPWLAWTYSVDLWDSGWTEEVKRQVIRESAEVHRRKGTVGAIRRAIEALGYGIEFTEWWQVSTGLDVHEFRVLVQTFDLGITPEVQRVIIAIIDNTKPLRSHMADISVTALVPPAEAYVGAVPFDGSYSYHVAEVGALPLPGIPDGSLALVGESAPFSIYQYEEATEEWYALLVYVEAFEDLPLPVDTRSGCLALVGDAIDLDEREVYVFIAGAWALAGDPRVIARALLADLPAAADVKTGTVAFVGGTPPEQEIHSSTGAAWLAHLVYRAAVGSLPATAREGAMALVGTGSPLRNRDAYLYEDAAWHLVTPSIRALSSWTDVQSTDRDGAAATYTDPVTGVVMLVRLTAALALPGGGTRRFWLPQDVWSWSGLTCRSYLDGSEVMPAVAGGTIRGNISNWLGASASVTSTGSAIRIASTTAGHYANLQSSHVLQPTERFYSRTRIRMSLAAAINVTALYGFLDQGTGQPQFVLTQNPTFNGGIISRTTLTNTIVGTNVCIEDSGSAVGAVAFETLEVRAGGTSGKNVEVRRNGRPYLSQRRNASVGASLTVGQRLIQLLTAVSGASWVDVAEDVFFTGS